MDAGGGTGLVGEVLYNSGFRRIDGTDISDEMVDKASALGAYRALHGDIDVNQPLAPEWLQASHAVLCCGAFTLGQVVSVRRQEGRVSPRQHKPGDNDRRGGGG